ncbi:MAG: T9SS type A sorting domain-containing protein [Bacteroidota bacterium]
MPLTNGFGAQPGNLIRGKVNSAWCLGNCTVGCDDLCDIEADITKVFWGTTRNGCRYKFIADNLQNPMCMDEYSFEWRIEGVIPVVSTSQEFIYDFSNFINGTYDVTLKITYNNGSGQCEDTVVDSVTIGCAINTNPTCPSASGLFIGEAEPCIDYMVSFPFNSGISSISWKYNIHGVNGEQYITTTSGPGPFAVPFSLPGGNNYDNDYLWVHADITLTNGATCRRSKSKLLDCPGGGGGGGQRISIVPNPTSDSFEVKSLQDAGIHYIYVRNMFGNVVRSVATQNEYKIQLGGEIAGVYFVEIQLEDGSIEIRKVILER